MLFIYFQPRRSLVRSEAHDHQDMGLCDQFLPNGGPKAVAFEKYSGYTQSDYKKLDDLICQNIINAKFEDRGINEQGHNMVLISLLLICKITGFC